jgi:hypothetical protein
MKSGAVQIPAQNHFFIAGRFDWLQAINVGGGQNL